MHPIRANIPTVLTPEDDAPLARAWKSVPAGYDDQNQLLFWTAARDAFLKQDIIRDSERTAGPEMSTSNISKSCTKVFSCSKALSLKTCFS